MLFLPLSNYSVCLTTGLISRHASVHFYYCAKVNVYSKLIVVHTAAFLKDFTLVYYLQLLQVNCAVVSAAGHCETGVLRFVLLFQLFLCRSCVSSSRHQRQPPLSSSACSKP